MRGLIIPSPEEGKARGERGRGREVANERVENKSRKPFTFATADNGFATLQPEDKRGDAQ